MSNLRLHSESCEIFCHSQLEVDIHNPIHLLSVESRRSKHSEISHQWICCLFEMFTYWTSIKKSSQIISNNKKEESHFQSQSGLRRLLLLRHTLSAATLNLKNSTLTDTVSQPGLNPFICQNPSDFVSWFYLYVDSKVVLPLLRSRYYNIILPLGVTCPGKVLFLCFSFS